MITSPTEGDGRLCFRRRRYVCEQLPGTNSSPIVTKLMSVVPLATRDEVIKFWKVKVGGGGMRSAEHPSSCVMLSVAQKTELSLVHGVKQ